MSNPYRALCAELLKWAERTSSHYYIQPDVIVRARALLAEPVIPVKQRIFPTPSQAAECGGPCYEGSYCPEVCDCGLYQPPALAEPEAEGPTDEELETFLVDVACQNGDMYYADTKVLARAVLARWGRPAAEPVPGASTTYFEFVIFDADDCTQAEGIAPTYAQALSEGQHYLAQYQQDGPHTLELRRVEVLNPDALPTPEATND